MGSTDKKTSMNPTQITAEAVNAICGILLEGYRINVNAIDAAIFGDIIKSACEKNREARMRVLSRERKN